MFKHISADLFALANSLALNKNSVFFTIFHLMIKTTSKYGVCFHQTSEDGEGGMLQNRKGGHNNVQTTLRL